ncbi:hypothetical protein EGM88_01670 [Aureibaculum marinum]|uniref:Uncharacterized protein n=2 Tax=Aureibaculum marinum TaxID=2487930 RepID=A0A3N4P532_9FLAO|nr:hypothetical protein EGM88_01670 [Aureibaculum marinum]
MKSIFKWCPYTLAVQKCITLINGNNKIDKPKDSKIIGYKNGIKMGRNITLVGVFCPFFWYTLISGKSTTIILMNAMHSGIVIVIGILVMLLSYLALLNYQNSNKNK